MGKGDCASPKWRIMSAMHAACMQHAFGMHAALRREPILMPLQSPDHACCCTGPDRSRGRHNRPTGYNQRALREPCTLPLATHSNAEAQGRPMSAQDFKQEGAQLIEYITVLHGAAQPRRIQVRSHRSCLCLRLQPKPKPRPQTLPQWRTLRVVRCAE